MPPVAPLLTLSSGATIPALGLGTWRSDAATLESAITHALATGYRHLDCAKIYGNERIVGAAVTAAIAAGVVTRAELFLTSKLAPTDMHPEAVEAALRGTLADLQTPYLDLFLLHWPFAFPAKPSSFPVPINERLGYDAGRVLRVWRELERLCDAGLIKSLGVSNFSRAKLGSLLAAARIPPAVNQLEMHPALCARRVLAWHKARGVLVTTYCPLGSPARPPTFMHPGDPSFLSDPTIAAIAAAHCRSPAQVLLRWAIQRGTVPLPKSVTPSRLDENLAVFDFTLSPTEKATIDALDVRHRLSRGEHFAQQGQGQRELWDGDDDADDEVVPEDDVGDTGALPSDAPHSFVARADLLACGTAVVTLSGGGFSATFAPALGAELSALSFHGTELLHRAKDFSPAPPGGWYGHAQTLFPAVGRSRGGVYTWEDGVTRPMPLHGLVLSAPFSLIALRTIPGAAAIAECELTSVALGAIASAAGEPVDAQCRDVRYPFDFSLRIRYTLTPRGLLVRHVVTHTCCEEGARMPFALGNHLSLSFPFTRGGGGVEVEEVTARRARWDAGRLSGSPSVELLLAPGSLLSGETRPTPLFAAVGGCPLDTPGVLDGVFACGGDDVDVSRPVHLTLSGGEGQPSVTVEQWLTPPPAGGSCAADWDALARARRLFVLWGEAPHFLCVEPWLGAPDALNCRAQGDALPVLGAGESAAWSYAVRVIDKSAA